MKLLWLCVVLPVLVLVWLLSRFQFRISIHRSGADRPRWVPSKVTRADKTVKLPVPPHVQEMIKEGRHEEAMKIMRDLAGARLNNGEGEVKTWTSDDGTVHVESRSVTYEAADIPPEVVHQIRDGDLAGAVKRLQNEKTGQRPSNRKSVDARRIDIPSKDEINDPKPKPFSLDE